MHFHKKKKKKKKKKRKSKQILCLKTKTTTKLDSNVEIFIRQSYSRIKKQLLIASELLFPNDVFYIFAVTL